MADTYFEYALSQCRRQMIESVCEVVSTRKALIEIANNGFNKCFNITADRRLLETVKSCLYNQDIINPRFLGRDALEIYIRSKGRIDTFSEQVICYERFFDLLVEVNWLQASIQNAKSINSQYVELLSDPSTLRRSMKKYLYAVYNSAFREERECSYIEEAMQAKGKIFTGLYPFRYEGSKYYASTDFTMTDLKIMKQYKRENSIMAMSLFLGLTATAAFADEIYKGLS